MPRSDGQSNKTLRWLRTHIAREVGRQERIAIAAVRQRLRAFPVSGNGQGKLWFGINPIEASRAGRPRQGRSGVSVAGRKYQGAFFKTVYGGNPDIWIRTASKHFDADSYPDSEVSGAVDDVLVGSQRTTVASRWPRRRSPWRTSGLTSRLGPIARTSAW